MKVGKEAAKSTDSSKTDDQVETYYTRALRRAFWIRLVSLNFIFTKVSSFLFDQLIPKLQETLWRKWSETVVIIFVHHHDTLRT